MKSREGFVSNSSSSSFMVDVKEGKVLEHLYFDIWQELSEGHGMIEFLLEHVREQGLENATVTINDQGEEVRYVTHETQNVVCL